MTQPTLYLAARLFNAAERLHNATLAKYLRDLGYAVITPQVEALRFFRGGRFETNAIAKDCRRSCTDSNVLVVCNIDGPDADSGSAIEFQIGLDANGRAIVYRTDFRTDTGREVGYNDMFRQESVEFVFHPCTVAMLEGFDAYYQSLAQKIHEAVQRHCT